MQPFLAGLEKVQVPSAPSSLPAVENISVVCVRSAWPPCLFSNAPPTASQNHILIRNKLWVIEPKMTVVKYNIKISLMQKSEVGCPGVIRVYLLHQIFVHIVLTYMATITKINSWYLMAALASIIMATFRVSGRQKRQSKQRSRVHKDLLWRKVPKFVIWHSAYITLDKIYYHVHTWFAKRARKWIYFSGQKYLELEMELLLWKKGRRNTGEN